MNPYKIVPNPSFVGRNRECNSLQECRGRDEANFVIVYGRRRIGKTELIEQTFKDEMVLKFEGIETDQKTNGAEVTKIQISQCARRLAKYLENPVLSKLQLGSWTDFFELLEPIAEKESVVLYFEEIQWLAGYQSAFFAELKPFWDDRWRHNPKLTIILCGSSTSFIIQELVSNKALYARAQTEIYLKPFSLIETAQFLDNMGKREIMQVQLTLGGVVEYLKQIKSKGSYLSNLSKKSFLPNAFFLIEYDKIFVSSLAMNKNYRMILEVLSQKKFATIKDLEAHCKLKAGGHFIELVNDLELCGFIAKYTPLHKDNRSKLVRYSICDEYLRYYYSFIAPVKERIHANEFSSSPEQPLARNRFHQVLGLSFERWCQRHSFLFAKIMGFSGVEYQAGAYFDKKTEALQAGFQIDLMYILKGSKVIICEIKYLLGAVNTSIATELQRKVSLFLSSQPKFKNYGVEYALIVADRPEGNSLNEFFDHIITLEEIFNEHYWR